MPANASRIILDTATTADWKTLAALDVEVPHRPLADGSVVVARCRGDCAGVAGVDLDSAALLGPWVAPAWRGRGVGRRLLVAAERRAAAFQLFFLEARVPPGSEAFFEACGWTPGGAGDRFGRGKTAGQRTLQRQFPRRQTRYGRAVAGLGAELGIPPDYGRRHRLPLQAEASRLADAGTDLYGRPQRLAPAALAAWRCMRDDAASDGVALQLVSAFRSLHYQAGLLRRKLERGQSMAQILAVSAAPGFSEHHTGRALDLTTPGAPLLEEGFEDSDAFSWLQRRAETYGFHLSFPRNNRHGLLYEPWHWCFKRKTAAQGSTSEARQKYQVAAER